MLKLGSDENFDGVIPRGLYRRRPELDVVRVQDVGLNAASDLWRPWGRRPCGTIVHQRHGSSVKYSVETLAGVARR